MNDWDWVIILSIYATLLGLSLTFYNLDFNSSGSLNANYTGNYSCDPVNCTQDPIANQNTGGIAFLNSLSFGLPSGLNIIFIIFFELLPGALLLILIYRLGRSGAG